MDMAEWMSIEGMPANNVMHSLSGSSHNVVQARDVHGGVHFYTTPAEAGSLRPRQLPRGTPAFTGRHHELSVLLNATTKATKTSGAAIVSAINGMAGTGKTALAVHVGQALIDRFPDGQLFIDLHGYTQGLAPLDPAVALASILQSYNIPSQQIPDGTEARAALYREQLAGTKTLIILDNAATEAQVRPLFPGASGCLVIITSRRRLKALDDVLLLSLSTLPEQDAMSLFRQIVGPGRTPANSRMLREVVQLCGFLPLALRIVGALFRHRPGWSLQNLVDKLQTTRSDLTMFSDGDRDLIAVFDLSYEALDVAQQKLFRYLGLVRGPSFDSYSAAALLETDPLNAERLLQGLVDHNLLVEPAEGRYQIHDLVRTHAYARVRTDPPLATAAAVSRLLDYYQYMAQRADAVVARRTKHLLNGAAPSYEPALPSADSAWTWLREERRNLEASIDYALDKGMDARVLALAMGLSEVLRVDGPWSRAVNVNTAAAAAADRLGNFLGQAQAFIELGMVRHLAGDYSRATDAHSRAFEIYQGLGDRLGQAHALTELGMVRQLTGDYSGASDVQTRAFEIYQELGDRLGQAYTLTELGMVRRLTGDYSGASDVQTRAFEIYQELGDRLGQAHALSRLGVVLQLTGDYSGAIRVQARAFEFYQELGDRLGQAHVLTRLGSVRRLTGDHLGATEVHTRGLEIYRALGSRSGEAWALTHLAAAMAASGQMTRALAAYRDALAMNRELVKPDDEAHSLEGIAECNLAVTNHVVAKDYLRQALLIFERLGMQADIERIKERLIALTTS